MRSIHTPQIAERLLWLRPERIHHAIYVKVRAQTVRTVREQRLTRLANATVAHQPIRMRYTINICTLQRAAMDALHIIAAIAWQCNKIAARIQIDVDLFDGIDLADVATGLIAALESDFSAEAEANQPEEVEIETVREEEQQFGGDDINDRIKVLVVNEVDRILSVV